MRTQVLKAFRVGSLVGGVFALVFSAAFVVWRNSAILLFVAVFVLFPWAAALNSNIASGTRYASFRSTGITDLDPHPPSEPESVGWA